MLNSHTSKPFYRPAAKGVDRMQSEQTPAETKRTITPAMRQGYAMRGARKVLKII